MAFDSHRAKSPSVMVGTRPVGLRARYSSSLVPPNSPPASWRRKGIPSSSQHHSTFCTFIEFFLPQISSTAYSSLSAYRDSCRVDSSLSLPGIGVCDPPSVRSPEGGGSYAPDMCHPSSGRQDGGHRLR